jgi:DNA (cytosine-5)-methyltransferase 1
MTLAAPAIDASAARSARTPHTVVDLFSGAGGMSCGFARHPAFAVVGAADAEIGKPSAGHGTLGCNASYARNIGVQPLAIDLGAVPAEDLRDRLALPDRPVVLCACAPCTGFSRMLAHNHLVDDARNSLVGRVAAFARALRPEVIVMENARELLMGRFAGHFAVLCAALEDDLGYAVAAEIHTLSEMGLPQRRERALVVAVRPGLPTLTLSDLWDGLAVRPDATTVRRAIAHLPSLGAGVTHADDPMHGSPSIRPANRRRLAAIPPDGGSWFDMRGQPDEHELLTPSMRRRAAAGDLGSHPDVYGRLAWDQPAATIKRECGHIGNGRYAHPEQDRLCTVREMALLQGFPDDYEFVSASLANRYRHVGDAVPPLVAYQLAALVDWILGADRPAPEDMVLPGCSLTPEDIIET